MYLGALINKVEIILEESYGDKNATYLFSKTISTLPLVMLGEQNLSSTFPNIWPLCGLFGLYGLEGQTKDIG